jgi:hypothetical protein
MAAARILAALVVNMEMDVLSTTSGFRMKRSISPGFIVLYWRSFYFVIEVDSLFITSIDLDESKVLLVSVYE